MSELQEEGINAINLPLSPSHYELDPEDTMLGKLLHTGPDANIQTHLLNLHICFHLGLLKTNEYKRPN